MCGILYVARQDNAPARKALLKRYHQQKERGTEGYGYIALDSKNKICSISRSETEQSIVRKLKHEDSKIIMFHHRYPTSTPNLKEMTHPIVVKHRSFKRTYYVIHNGVITNTDTLKSKHIMNGFKYTTEMYTKNIWNTQTQKYWEREDFHNDSESFALELALVLEGKKDEIETEGTVAFIAFEATKSGIVKKLHYGRNYGNSLKVEIGRDMFVLRSEGRGETVMAHRLHSYDFETKKTDSKYCNIGTGSFYSDYGYNSKQWADDGTPVGSTISKADRREIMGYHNEPLIQVNTMTDKRYDEIDRKIERQLALNLNLPTIQVEGNIIPITLDKLSELGLEYDDFIDAGILIKEQEKLKTELGEIKDLMTGMTTKTTEWHSYLNWAKEIQARLKTNSQRLTALHIPF